MGKLGKGIRKIKELGLSKFLCCCTKIKLEENAYCRYKISYEIPDDLRA